MKKALLFALGALLTGYTWSQTANAVVYSEAGEKFTLYLNGEQKNDKPAVNVKIGGLTGEFYQARIDFEDPKLPDFSHNNFAVKPGLESTYVVRLNKKGGYVLRWFSEGPKSFDDGVASKPAPAPVVDQSTKNYAEVDDIPAPATTPATSASTQVNAGGQSVNAGVTVKETTTTTTTSKPTTTGGKTENVNIGMNVGGFNMGVNMSVPADDVEMESSETVTTTTTTTTKTTTSGGSATTTVKQPVKPAPAPQPAPRPAVTPAPQPEPVVMSTPAGCGVAMSKTSFDKAKQSISTKGFEEDKMKVAKQATKANCLSVDQIKEVMMLFGFEESKLEYAKFAYDYCVDKGDYYQINDAFGFSSSVDELNEYLEGK